MAGIDLCRLLLVLLQSWWRFVEPGGEQGRVLLPSAQQGAPAAPTELCISMVSFEWRCRPVTQLAAVTWPMRSAQQSPPGMLCMIVCLPVLQGW